MTAAIAPDPLFYVGMHRNAVVRKKRQGFDRACEYVEFDRRLECLFREQLGRTPAGFSAMTMCERAIRCDLTMRELLRIAR